MSESEPFDHDVHRFGQYLYTGDFARLSARLATTRQSVLLYRVLDELTPRNILDYGCGDGYFTAALARRYSARVVGFDPSVPAIQVAQSKFGDFSNLKFYESLDRLIAQENEQFDVVILRGVVRHAKDPKGVIESSAKLSNTVLVLEPNGLNLVLKLVERLSTYHKSHGEQSFTPWRITKWMRESGIERTTSKVGVIVPYFCPGILAKILHLLQPAVEHIPLVRWFLCGTQLHLGTVRKV